MNDGDQLSLSRYVDGDLSPLERKKVEAMLDSDPAARRMFAEYSRMRQFVRDLPREPLNQDILPLVQAALHRKSRFGTLTSKSPWAGGLLAASVLIATFSIAFLASQRQEEERFPPTGLTIESPPITVLRSEPDDHDTEVPATVTVTNTEKDTRKPGTIAPPATSDAGEAIDPSIAMAFSQSSGSVAMTRSSTGKTPSLVAAKLDSRFRNFRDAAKSIDRRHNFRLHVKSASRRQIASILTVIGQFRASEFSVIEHKSSQETDRPGLAYVALIPTVRIAEFQTTLRGLSGIEMELDKPENLMNFEIDQLPQNFRIVEDSELHSSENFAAPPKRSEDTSKPSPVKRNVIENDVPDAISLPLPVDDAADQARGTLDEVIVWIRTDPLRIEDQKSRPTRPGK